MARKRTKKETPVSVSEYTEGGMTVNINIGKEGGSTAPNVYDDDGNQISETGAPADYEMDYAADEEMPEEGADAPEAAADEESSDDLGLEDEGGEEEMPSEEGEGGEEEMPSEEPSMETEDVSDDMEDGDKKVASLAAEYTEDELFDALSLKKKAASMMEGGSDSMSSYGEMPEGLKKHMEEKGDGEEKKEEDEDEEKKTEDMGEETAPSADDKTEVSDNGEGCSKDYEEDKEEDKEEDEEKKKSDMSEEETLF
jgi:AAA ATPase containing von Willebrand factor type A (vWA) domain